MLPVSYLDTWFQRYTSIVHVLTSVQVLFFYTTEKTTLTAVNLRSIRKSNDYWYEAYIWMLSVANQLRSTSLDLGIGLFLISQPLEPFFIKCNFNANRQENLRIWRSAASVKDVDFWRVSLFSILIKRKKLNFKKLVIVPRMESHLRITHSNASISLHRRIIGLGSHKMIRPFYLRSGWEVRHKMERFWQIKLDSSYHVIERDRHTPGASMKEKMSVQKIIRFKNVNIWK